MTVCTAIRFDTKSFYFGRTLDVELEYNENVTISPRKYKICYTNGENLSEHFAMIGIATVIDGYPLYFDAVNEHGLAIAALRFAENANYFPSAKGKINVASFELIPYLLSKCKSIKDAKLILDNLNITDASFKSDILPSPLHWMVCDRHESIVIESMGEGLTVWPNEIGVLTNNPPFSFHRQNLAQYLHLTTKEVENTFSKSISLHAFSRGMGAIGLPGDLCSTSRFVRAAFTRSNAKTKQTEEENVTQFFHILSSVEQTEGCVEVGGFLEKTVYSACMNCDKGIYYYKTYENSQITAVSLLNENLDATNLCIYPLTKMQHIRNAN